LKPGQQNYSNPFKIEDFENNQPSNKPANQPNLLKNEYYDQKISELIKNGMDLQKRMINSEKNKDLDLSSVIEEMLVNSSDVSREQILEDYRSDPASLYQPKTQFRNKQSELENLRLNTQFPLDFGTRLSFAPKDENPNKELSYNQIQRHKLCLSHFQATNPILKEKLKGKEILVEVQYPILQQDAKKKADFEVYKYIEFLTRFKTDEDAKKDRFKLDQEIDSQLDLNSVGLQRLSASKLKFIVSMKTDAKNKFEEICSGELNMENILMSPNFDYRGQVPLKVVLNPERSRKVVVDKKNLPQLDVITSDAGFIELQTRFYNPALDKKAKPVERQATAPQPMQERPSTDTRVFRDLGQNPVCLFLHVKDAKCVPQSEQRRGERNLYLEHKVYGTTESIRSQISWGHNSPVIDHRVTIPLSQAAIEMMVRRGLRAEERSADGGGLGQESGGRSAGRAPRGLQGQSAVRLHHHWRHGQRRPASVHGQARRQHGRGYSRIRADPRSHSKR
jgi:hypothetical protein